MVHKASGQTVASAPAPGILKRTPVTIGGESLPRVGLSCSKGVEFRASLLQRRVEALKKEACDRVLDGPEGRNDRRDAGREQRSAQAMQCIADIEASEGRL